MFWGKLDNCRKNEDALYMTQSNDFSPEKCVSAKAAISLDFQAGNR